MMQNDRSSLEQVLGAAVGCCPAYHSWVKWNPSRFCPLQVEAISTLEDAGWTRQQMSDLHVSIFAPPGRSTLSFECARYKSISKPCLLEQAVVDSLIQLIL